MTDQTASELSKMLVELLKQHGFTCVGTFALGEFDADQEFNEYKEDYKYSDTETGFNELVRTSQIRRESRSGLYNLVITSLEFFKLSTELPSKFRNTLSQLADGQNRLTIRVNSINQEIINVDEYLNNKNTRQLIRLLETILDYIDRPDEEFFVALDQINE